jgi:hypothetical protein
MGRITFLLELVLLTLLAGCATIVGGSDQLISVNSNVQGADVILNGARVGVTPFNGKVKKQREPSLAVEKEGYLPAQQVLSTQTPTIFWGNIIFGGPLCSTTDFASGAMFEISPANYYINLQPIEKKSTGYDYRIDTELKEFVMVNYQDLKKDFSRGNGEYLEAILSKYFQKYPVKPADVIAKFRDLAASDITAIQLGEDVAKFYFANYRN